MAYYNGKEISFFPAVNLKQFQNLVAGNQSNLTEVTLAELGQITSIKQGAFADCYKLTKVEIPNTVKTIGKRAFYACLHIPSLVIPDAVTVIEDETFYFMTGLTDITLPSNLKSIGSSAFNQCIRLETITIPSTVTEIKNTAFATCSKLATIKLEATTPPILGGNSVFYNCKALARIIVPSRCGAAYKAATNWAAFAGIIEEATE